MSKLDIELQKQTADVSMTEMVEEVDVIKTALLSKETRKEEISIGEDGDGK